MKFSLNKKVKNMIAIIFTIVGLLILFFYFFNNSPVSELNSSLELETGDYSNGESSDNNEFKNETSYLNTLLSLNKITIDPSLFTSTTFQSLKDNTVEIIGDGIVGRDNPFIPFDQQNNEEIVDLVDLTELNSNE